MDRTKEPGSVGEPLYEDVVSALYEAGKGNHRCRWLMVLALKIRHLRLHLLSLKSSKGSASS